MTDDEAIQRAIRLGMMIGRQTSATNGALLGGWEYVVMRAGPNGSVPSDLTTTSRLIAAERAKFLLSEFPNGFRPI